jgi:transposase
MVVALAIVAAIGEVGRFEQSQNLVSYLGLNPSVRQSGPGPRITAGSRSRAVGMRAACSSRRLGRQRERRVRCGRVFRRAILALTQFR